MCAAFFAAVNHEVHHSSFFWARRITLVHLLTCVTIGRTEICITSATAIVTRRFLARLQCCVSTFVGFNQALLAYFSAAPTDVVEALCSASVPRPVIDPTLCESLSAATENTLVPITHHFMRGLIILMTMSSDMILSSDENVWILIARRLFENVHTIFGGFQNGCRLFPLSMSLW